MWIYSKTYWFGLFVMLVNPFSPSFLHPHRVSIPPQRPWATETEVAVL